MAKEYIFNPNSSDLSRQFYYMKDEGAMRIDESVSGNTYIGYTYPGVAETESLWKIKKIVSGADSITRIYYPVDENQIPTKEYIFSWSNRTGYTYFDTGEDQYKLSTPPVDIAVYVGSSKIYDTIVVLNSTTIELMVVGGQLGDLADWYWYDDHCTGNLIGQGVSVTYTLNQTTTFYVKASGYNITTCTIKKVLASANI